MCIGVKLNVPPKLGHANEQMPKSMYLQLERLHQYIYMERAIQRIKVYRILSSVVPLSLSLTGEELGVCCALTLLLL